MLAAGGAGRDIGLADRGEQRGRKARAIVVNDDVHPAVVPGEADFDIGLRELRRVLDEIAEAVQDFGAARDDRLGARRQRIAHDLDLDILASSEEHTSGLQSLLRNSYVVFCLKKKNKTIGTQI